MDNNYIENNYIQDIYKKIKIEMSKRVIGQESFIKELIITLFSGGHILVEGAPGLGKTLTIKTLAEICNLGFKRIQFTPDLMPSDLTGSTIFNQKTNEFEVKKGPLFSNLILADEINRSPSKVQSALLEAMEERQITIGKETFILERPFLILGTQNPIENEGTYNLPEAQMDRFFMKSIIEYPTIDEEKKIINLKQNENIEKVINKEILLKIQKEIENIKISEKIKDYIIKLSNNTRKEKTNIDIIEKYVEHGVSPRGTLALIKAVKVLSALKGKKEVDKNDIKEIIFPCFRHRIILKYEAIVDDISVDDIIQTILEYT